MKIFLKAPYQLYIFETIIFIAPLPHVQALTGRILR